MVVCRAALSVCPVGVRSAGEATHSVSQWMYSIMAFKQGSQREWLTGDNTARHMWLLFLCRKTDICTNACRLYKTVLLAKQSNNITTIRCVCACESVCVRWWMSVFREKWVPITSAFYRQIPRWLPNGYSTQSPRTHICSRTHAHSHNELQLRGPRLWHICCRRDMGHSCRDSQDSPCNTIHTYCTHTYTTHSLHVMNEFFSEHKEKEGVVVGLLTILRKKSLLNKNTKTYWDTFSQIGPLTFRYPLYWIHTAFSILELETQDGKIETEGFCI